MGGGGLKVSEARKNGGLGRRICSLGFQPNRRKFYTTLLLTMNRVETDDKKWGTTYQLLWVRVRVRVRVFCRVKVRVRVSVSCRTGGSFLKDKGISLLSVGKNKSK